jgi:glycosyltransferase involved in cell wall biosynthesis
MSPLRVCIDARIPGGKVGGVEQFIIGLASGLSKLTDGSEEYFFLTYSDAKDWITPYLGGSCQILEDKSAPVEFVGETLLKQKFPRMTKLWHAIDPLLLRKSIPQPKSNGLIEKAQADVMHFTTQGAFITDVPSIYHPHDLQHIHIPEFFTKRISAFRDQKVRTFCNQARMVAVVSSWGKKDLIQQYQLDDDIVKIVPYAPVVDVYSEPDAEDLVLIQKKYQLPKEYIFYPAQTWPHKNHIGLLKAMALMRDQMDTKVSAVFSGRQDEFYPTIMKKVVELGLEDQVFFVGFVDPLELRGLYSLSRCVVIPSKFEAASFPIWEAFMMGSPVACSNVTSLPEQVGDSALLFDPSKPEEIAHQTQRLWKDESLRRKLVERGMKNVSRFSWERTARIFRAHYRRIVNRTLTDDDIELINGPPLF